MKISILLTIFHLFICPGFSQSTWERIDSLLNRYYAADLPGSMIAIRQKNKIIFEKGYGVTDLVSRKPITADDNFNIGSLTKQFTAFAVLDLYYQAKLSLSDPIGKYLKLPAPLASILISELLGHSSGIPDHYSFTDTFRVKHATDNDVLAALQKADSLYFISGTHYRYSNTAYCLLGLLVEKCSGIPYPSYLQEQVFGPLGIKDARVFRKGELIPLRVTGYERRKDGTFIRSDGEESIFFSTEADGGIYISMKGFMKWCNAVESLEFSGTPMVRKAWQGHTLVDTAQSLWYGYGWFIHQHPGSGASVYHTGSNGGFRSVVFMIPSQDYCISIFSNRSDIDLEDLVSRINHILDIDDNYFIKSAPLESFIHSWPKFAPCKETSSFSTSFRKNSIARDMELN